MSAHGEKPDRPLVRAIKPVLIVCCCVVLAPVMIVLLSYAEFRLTKTAYVEDACRRLHIHEPIGKVFQPIFDKLKRL
ncbi:MAG TPA: hypothetical protein VG055_12895 [Planctomycetaceae bacterium]|nr:hypothetical protein [Planctomycetaceae bacterium]